MEIWLKCSTDKTGLIYLKPQLMVTFVACFKSQSGLGVSYVTQPGLASGI